jgi:uncharacterized protein
MTFHHGISASESTSGLIPIRTTATAVIGLIAYASDADDTAFPLNTPVLITSISRALVGAGYAGTLRKSLEAIQPITNPTIVVIRIEDPTTVGFDSSLIIGQNVDGNRSGIQCLLTAKSILGITPKILVAPELETPDVVQALAAIAKKLRAYCYVTPRDPDGQMLPTAQEVVAYRDTLGDREVELIWPEWTSGNVLQPSTPSSNGLSSITLYAEDSGSLNDLLPDLGDTLTITVNGVATQSAAFNGGSAQSWVLQALIGAGLNANTSTSGDITYNWQINAPLTGSQVVTIVPTSSDRVIFRANLDGGGLGGMPLDPDVNQLDPVSFTLSNTSTGSTDASYGAGILNTVSTAAALRAQLDEQVGWHKSLSNVVVNSPTGMSQAITWDLEDPDTDAGYLNSHDVTTMIQHQGFRFWGNRNCSSDPRFAFEVATRTAQTVLETIVQGCFPFMDQPLTPQLAKDIIDSINAKLDAFVAAGVLIGARCWYDDAQNNSQDLSQGQLWVDYDYNPVPTLENLGLNQRITDRYLVDFAKLIAQAA